MSAPPFDVQQASRWFAVELNNLVWDWLDGKRPDLNAEQMVHAAHASCHHWLQVGGPANHARGECLVANAHAAVSDGPGALRHAQRCLELSRAHAADLSDWDQAFAHDVLARAYAAVGEMAQAERARRLARELGDKIADSEDKRIFDQWHRSGNWHGLTPESAA